MTSFTAILILSGVVAMATAYAYPKESVMEDFMDLIREELLQKVKEMDYDPDSSAHVSQGGRKFV